MKQLYDFNHQPELWGTVTEEGNFVPAPPLPKDHPNAWNGKGGALARRALQAIYTIAFICLLRSDEVLKIKRNHITFLNDGTNGIVLTLPFRKTHQSGGMLSKASDIFTPFQRHLGVKPFYLYPLPEEEAHLCPVRALSEWIAASKITSGNLFRKIMSNDRPSSEELSNMVVFLKSTSPSLLSPDDIHRPRNSSLTFSVTIYWMSRLIPCPTELTHSVVVDANTCHQDVVGVYVGFVSGEVGVLSSRTSRLFAT